MAKKRRQQRVAEFIKEQVSELVLLRIKDPRLSTVTITDAEITADLRQATVWYSVLGDGEARKEAEEGLESAGGYIRRELGSVLNLRHTPELAFKRDDSWERGARIDALLEQIAQEENE